MAGVFISYRREDSPGHAGRIFDRLQARFGADIVFMDVHAIDAGVDFAAAIERAVASCAALLAIIGPDWMTAVDEEGQRRLHDPRDFVRLEIGGALKRGIRVVPVLVDNAGLPAPDDLPDELKPLVGRHAVVLRDSRWDADFDELARAVERLVLPVGQQESPSAGRTELSGGLSTRNWVWGAAAGMVMIAAGGAAAASRGCAPAPDETKAAATAPAPAVPAVPVPRGEPSPEAASSGAGERAGSPRVAADVARETGPAPARRGKLGIAWFGVWLDTITDNPRGVIVGDVAPGGPAARAGIEVNDVLIEMAGRPVASFTDVSNAVVGHVKSEPPDTPAMVHVVRDGTRLQLPVVFDRQFVLRR
jgi:hypothetical protein